MKLVSSEAPFHWLVCFGGKFFKQRSAGSAFEGWGSGKLCNICLGAHLKPCVYLGENPGFWIEVPR